MATAAPIIVVGHKNPDNDSICAAVGYAYLKNELARREARDGEVPAVYVPARLGPLPPESSWILKENGLPLPEVVGHVHARVSDVMTPDPISIAHDATLLEAGRLLRQHNVRALVVTNDDGTYRGLITTRMIADIPGVKYTEGRFLPYFFPDTFYEGNDPSIEGLDNWRKARRAILRSPISRMGYGGYLSLAAKFPKFVDTVTHIANEFRDIHDRTGGVAAEGELNVAILNSWGKMRSWMAFTVAHALPNKQTYSYYGILESLSGMRVNVRFISFDDVLAHGIDSDIDVIINGGPVDTAFTGGDVWTNPKLVETVRAWVRGGGAFVGVGEPSSAPRFQTGRFFQLADVIGVDEERYQTLSVDKYFPPVVPDHFITADVPVDPAAREAWEQAGYRIPLSGCGGGQSIKPLGGIDFGEPVLNTYPVNENVTLLRADGGQVQLATNDYGKGRGVYISGLPYSAANARLLERVLFYASHNEDKYAAWSSSNPECEVAHFPEQGLYCVINNTDQPQKTTVTLADGTTEDFDLPDSGIAWREA